MEPARDKNPGWKGLRPFEKRLAAVGIAVVIVVASFGAYYAISGQHGGKRTLVVYTYGSFMAYGANKTAAFQKVFGTFEKEYNVSIVVRTPAQGLLSALKSQNGTGQADLVIGLTNMDGVQAARDGLLVSYTPPADAYISQSLKGSMGSASPYLTPYEYAYLGVDFNKSVFQQGGTQFRPTFGDLSNSSAASNLLLENPLYDSTGEGFLLWEIAYYQMLHQNWTNWWKAVKPYVQRHIYDSWSTAFGYFGTGPGTNLLASYLTDPAYNYYFGYGNGTGSTVTYSNGTAYGWQTVYCIGIVNGSHSIPLDRAFVNYFLGPGVQNEIPQNEWMYPANQTIQLPQSFNYAVDPSNVVPLNEYLNASTIATNLQAWELQWQQLMG